VGAIIDLGNCLDLTESISLDIVNAAYHHLRKVFKVARGDDPFPANKKCSDSDEDLLMRSLDCAVINHVHSLNEMAEAEPFSTVRGAFHEGEPLYPGAAIRKQTHIQLCVRNQSCIRGIFRIPDVDKL